MRIGFYGGSFDPPHLGHLAVAQAAAQAFALDRVLLAPTALQPLKPQGSLAPFADRLAMVRLLCAQTLTLEASELEAPNVTDASSAMDAPNYTIDTLARLRAQLTSNSETLTAEIFVIVGIDAFLDLERWRSPRALLAAAQWIVVARPEFDTAQLDTMHLTVTERFHVHVFQDLHVPISATEIRRRLSTGEDCSEYLPASVLHYIREHKLYGAK